MDTPRNEGDDGIVIPSVGMYAYARPQHGKNRLAHLHRGEVVDVANKEHADAVLVVVEFDDVPAGVHRRQYFYADELDHITSRTSAA